MTAPNQSIDQNVVKNAVGMGAWTIGGGGHSYGQDITEAFVHTLVLGPAALLTGGITGVENALSQLGSFLSTLPLQALQMFQGFIPGTVAADFANIGAAVSTIINSLLINPLESIVRVIQQIMDIFNGLIVTPINAAVQGVKDWFTGLSSWRIDSDQIQVNLQTMFNQIGDIVNGLIVTPLNSVVANFSDWFANLIGFQRNTTSTQVNLQNFAISAITSTARNPTWVCRYPIGDVVYPEYMNAQYEVYGTTDGASTGTAHTHTLSLTNRTYSDAAGWSVLQNQSRGSYITISNSTVIDTMGMMLWKETGSLDNIFMELFRENVDGSLVRLVYHDVSASITSSVTYVEVDIPGQIAQAGERYLIRLRNASSTATVLRAVSTTLTDAMVQGQFFTGSSGLTAQTSYTAAECATARAASLLSPWGLLAAKNLAETDQSFSDDFNRSALGGLWSLITVTLAGSAGPTMPAIIYNNQCVSPGSLTDGGALFKGLQSGIYVRPTNGDAQRIDANLYPYGGFYTGLPMHCSREGTQAVMLGVSSTRAAIYTGSLTVASMTERAAVSVGGAGLWSMYYDQGNNKYIVLKDGDPVGLEWTDSGNEVQHGRDYRYGGFRHHHDTGFGSGSLDNWTLRDWHPPV